MKRATPDSSFRALLALGSVALVACSSLLQLDELEKVDCVDDCGGAATQAGSPALGSGGTSVQPHAGSGVTPMAGKGGSGTSGSAGSTSGSGVVPSEGGSGEGGAGTLTVCPGGVEPDAHWQEHWFEHKQNLDRAQYDDCIAVYIDADMVGIDITWLTQFLSNAWAYSLNTYGMLGEDRLYVVLHKNKYLGAHAEQYFEASHDFRNVIDAGSNTWNPGAYDMPAHVLSYVVEGTAAHEKHGSPASWLWHGEGFAEIYKYDLYMGLGMTDVAEAAYDYFETVEHTYPVAHSYWFSDWYYPVWRDHGQTQVLVKFFGLLEQYYPATNQLMPNMTWGEYIHFMSGAAGADLKEQATYAFGWDDTWEQELAQAKIDFPLITY